MSNLETLKKKYLWWEPIEGVPFREERVIAQVMDIGDSDDMRALASEVSDERLRSVISLAQPGWFSPRSWSYWHYRGLSRNEDAVPPSDCSAIRTLHIRTCMTPSAAATPRA